MITVRTEETGGLWAGLNAPSLWAVYCDALQGGYKVRDIIPLTHTAACALDPGQIGCPLVGGYKPCPPGRVDPRGGPSMPSWTGCDRSRG